MIRDMVLPEFDQEMATTRRVLERVPTDRLGWKPHEKSFPMGRLAGHLATLPQWTAAMLAPEFDLAAVADVSGPPSPDSTAAVLDTFDRNVASARSLIAGMDDTAMLSPWVLRKGPKVLFQVPRVAALRGFIISHSIHHRGQLTVYLRLNDVPVPQVYGPTADEPDF